MLHSPIRVKIMRCVYFLFLFLLGVLPKSPLSHCLIFDKLRTSCDHWSQEKVVCLYGKEKEKERKSLW